MARSNGGSWLKWLIILLLLGGAGYGGWWYWQKPDEKAPEYRTATVARGDLIQAVTASGQLNPMLNVQVGSQISGMIQKLFVDFNSSVTQGQVIAEIDPATYRANMNQAEGDLASAQAGLELAQVEAKRAKELVEAKLIPASDNDKAIATLHQAEAQVKIRAASLEKARVDLSRCTIYAPTNGMVISRSVDVGQTVAASLSAPVLFIIATDLSRMQIDAMVSEADIGGVEEGQTATFNVDAFPSRMFRGKVTQIRNSPYTNQNVVTYDTVVSVENRDLRLKPGMTANVSITIAEREGVVKIPNAALRFRPADAVNPASASVTTPRSTGGAGGPGGRGASGEGGRRQSSGGSGSGGPGGSGQRMRGERSPTRTIYTLSSTNSTEKPVAKQIKVGISDGMSSEVLEGLEEGEIIVVGLTSPEPPRVGAPTGQSNPFGGGGRRF